MMARLYKTSLTAGGSAELLLDQLDVADTFWARGWGLLGRSQLGENEALWIKRCNNIHTWFMKFRIDCIFVDRNLKIQGIAANVPRFWFAGPYWKATSVIETAAGFVERKKLKVGDHLYVVH